MLTDLGPQQLEQLFEAVSSYFTLLSEPTRIKILYSLCGGEKAAGDIVKEVGSTQANVSRHLNMLYRAKVLARRKDGTQVYYRIEDQNTFILCNTVCSHMSAGMEEQSTFSQHAAKPIMTADS